MARRVAIDGQPHSHRIEQIRNIPARNPWEDPWVSRPPALPSSESHARSGPARHRAVLPFGVPGIDLPVPGIGRARWQRELIRVRAGESADFEVEPGGPIRLACVRLLQRRDRRRNESRPEVRTAEYAGGLLSEGNRDDHARDANCTQDRSTLIADLDHGARHIRYAKRIQSPTDNQPCLFGLCQVLGMHRAFDNAAGFSCLCEQHLKFENLFAGLVTPKVARQGTLLHDAGRRPVLIVEGFRVMRIWNVGP